MRRYLSILIALLSMICCLSACGQHTIFEKSNAHFIERSYWFDDPQASLDLTLYFTGEPFVEGMDEVSQCSVGIDENAGFACELIKLELKDEPLYVVDGVEYYQGGLSVRFKDLSSTIRGAQLSLKLKDGTVHTFPIGDIFFSDTNDSKNSEAHQFIEYALINPAIYADAYGCPKTGAIALEIQVLRSITIERLSWMLEETGFDVQGIMVYSYDDYAANISEPLDNMELDKAIEGIYDRRIVADQNTSCNIELDSGRFVLLIPITQSSEDVLEPVFAGLDIGFNADGANYSLHIYCNPLFTENYHSLTEVTAPFES